MSRREPGTHRPERQRLPHALRAVLLAILVMAAVLASAIWRLADLGSSTSNLLHQVKDTQDANHASRLEFEAKLKAANAYTQSQVSKLACSVVAFTPPAHSNAFVRSLAVTYHCPPYKAPATTPALQFSNPAPPTPPATASPSTRASGWTASSTLLSSTAVAPSSAPASRTPSPTASPVCLVALVCLP